MLPDFSRLRILVVGDLMIDRYLYGRVDRISPEAPVPVVNYLSRENRPGGAANVALNLAALGVKAGIAGAVGRDGEAGDLAALLSDRGIALGLLVAETDRPTTVKTRIISQGQQLLRVDRESTADLHASAEEEMIAAVTQRLDQKSHDGLVLQDYNKGVLTDRVIAGLIAAARERGVPVIVDPKAKRFWAYRGVSLFKPNLREIQQQCGFTVRPHLPDLDRAAAVIFDRLDCDQVMITLSEHGIYTNDGKRSAIFPTVARRVADVSGAGDTVVSVAACGIAAGMSLTEVARLANLAGAQVISEPGVVAVDLEKLRRDWSLAG